MCCLSFFPKLKTMHYLKCTSVFTKPKLMTRLFSSSSSSGGFGAWSWWDHVRPAYVDPITGVTEAFLADPNPNKINLGVVGF